MMKCKLVFTVVFVVGSGLSTTCLAQTGVTLDALTRSSHIIFLGRVVKLQAANVEVLKAGENTAVVRVEELLDAPEGVAGLKGQDVTVELSRAQGMKTEQQAVFFTNGVLFGQHLAVKEVGQLPAPTDWTQMKAQIAAVRAKMAEETLQARVASSVLVIVGKVISVKKIERIGPISEHEGDWAVAVVQIEAIEKGSFDGKTVDVYFPQSTDERWLLSPKFHVGQQGVWLLHRESNLGLPEAALTALSALDFQPLGAREKVRRLLK
jgi:hypothetical protein